MGSPDMPTSMFSHFQNCFQNDRPLILIQAIFGLFHFRPLFLFKFGIGSQHGCSEGVVLPINRFRFASM